MTLQRMLLMREAQASCAMERPRPSDAQVATVISAIECRPEAEILATMDEFGEMVLSMTEDELTTTAWFDRDGVIVGDWL